MKKHLRRQAEAAEAKARGWTFPIKCSWWRYTGEYTPMVEGRSSQIMENIETGERANELPLGACFDASLDPETGAKRQHEKSYYPEGSDGCAVIPSSDGPRHWYIDSRASNCTLPNDDVHRCWVRTGTVGGKLTVGKGQNSCKAGAGSIKVPGYHGYLRNGELVLA